MEIGNEVNRANSMAINKKTTVNAIQQQPKEMKTENKEINNTAAIDLNLSASGKLTQKIDATSEEIDNILMRHVSPEQKEKLDGIYKKLDSLYEKESLTGKDGKSTDTLLKQANVILDDSAKKLSGAEQQTIDKLTNKMDTMSSQLNNLEGVGNSTDLKKNNLAGAGGNSGDTFSRPISREKQSSTKSLTVAQLNGLSVTELNKLNASQLKKLNAAQLNKLSTKQLNCLDMAQLKQLSPSNVNKLNQSQIIKLS